MNRTSHVIKSEKLGKNVNVRVYGTKGYPVIAFPTQDQMADEWENNGMTDVFAPYIDADRVQLFTVDSNDLESWSNPSTDFAARINRQEDYYNFVCDELLPFVHETNGSQLRPELTGASLGATQATICALRRPDLFQGVIALSGMYHTSYFFGDWGNDVSYANDVNAFLPNTPADHPYIKLYRERTFAFSIGQAPDEQFGVDDLHFLQQTFDKLGISGWFDFWGPECNHDWYWWKQQMAKFLPEAVKELEGVAAAEPELAKPAKKAEKATPKAVEKNAKPAVKAEKSTAKASTKPATKPATKATAKPAAKATTTKTTAQAAKSATKAAEKPAAAAKAPKAQKSTAKANDAKVSATAATVKATPKTTAKSSAKAASTKTETAKPATAAKASATKAAASKSAAKTTKRTTKARKTTSKSRHSSKKSSK